MNASKEFKLIVAGGRDFTDYAYLSRVLFEMADVQYEDREVSIISGMAKGADALGYRFAREHGICVYTFPANWDKHGKAAGFMRNEEMGKAAHGLLAFWDGQSRGTAHMIQFMKQVNKPVTVVNY